MRTDTTTQRIFLPIASIIEGDRVRSDYGDLQSLADSIRTEGLIHPVVVDLNYRLVAGGRRLRAQRDVLKLAETAVTFIEVADDATLRRLEAEENVRRKDMTWQEVVRSIKTVHQHQVISAAVKSSQWTQTMTGGLLGKSQAHVSNALLLADLLDKGDPEVDKCPDLSSALKLLLKRKEDEANAFLARATLPQAGAVPARPTAQDILAQDSSFFTSVAPTGPAVGLASRPDVPELPKDVTVPNIVVPLTSMLFRADAIEWLRAQPAESFDHCITDPPYAIDMDMIQQDGGGMNVDSTRAEHQVEPNRQLLQALMPEVYRTLKPNSFFIMWCDFEQWESVFIWAMEAGFAPQRWPLAWVKTHQCQNMAAQYNFTKNIEIAMVCRKGNATLISPQQSCYWQGTYNGNEKDTYGHPFAKPASLWKWLYGACTIRGQRVLDPFAGSGSSTLAAISSGLSPVAVECNEAHYNRLVVNVSNYYRTLNPNTSFT